MSVPCHLLLAGGLLGAAASGCEPKTIGAETAGNLVCEDGDTKDADDGCNTCTCEGGDWKCTLKACGGCVDGELMPAPDGCNTCTCEDGSWLCSEIGCPATDGDPGMCGDGIVQAPEQCDDGNNVGGDGCSAMCTIEGGDTSTSGGEPGDDTVGDDTSGSSSGGEPGVCGDGNVDDGEPCDDGNVAGGDGCSPSCTIEDPGQPLFCVQPIKVDPFVINAAAIVGDALAVDVSYGGGCETHDFSYCWDGLWLESFPVQIHTEISHDGHDDACDAWISEQLEFDLSGLKQAYQDGYQTQNGEITIHLADWGEALSYTF